MKARSRETYVPTAEEMLAMELGNMGAAVAAAEAARDCELVWPSLMNAYFYRGSAVAHMFWTNPRAATVRALAQQLAELDVRAYRVYETLGHQCTRRRSR